MSLTRNMLTLMMLGGLLTACEHDDHPTPSGHTIVLGAQVAGPTTRAEDTGLMDYKTIARSDVGFGVYAYGFTSGDYSSSSTPQHWNNRRVTHLNPSTIGSNPVDDIYLYPGNWTYGTAEDWPQADATDQKMSFFAYAPYGSSALNPSSATSGDPTVGYTANFNPTTSTDLLWGIDNTTGLPWLNATSQTTGGPVLFTFQHACAAIGFHVQAMVDKDNNLSDLTDESDLYTGFLGGDCKVTLKSITLTRNSGNFYSSGTLNLNNVTPYQPSWSGKTASSNNALTLEGTNIDTPLRDQGDMSPDNMTDIDITGVTKAADYHTVITANATTGNEQLFFLIPEDGDISYTCTVEYYVTYKNTNVSSGGYTRLAYTDVNARTANITMPLQAGTKYYINLVIGLRTFSLSVSATDWTGVQVNTGTIIEHGTSASESLARQSISQ